MQYKKLGEIATFTRGLTYSKKDEASEVTDKMVLRSNNIDLDSHSLVLDEIKYLVSDYVIPEDKKLHKGDLFICMSNGSKQHLGKVAYIYEDMDFAFGGFMGAISTSDSINSKYLYYFCISNKYKSLLLSIGKGANINNIKFSELSEFSLPVPPLSTQSRIVSELDLLTSLIDNQKKQLDELSKLQQSTFYSMFGDPVENEKEWPVKTISEVCSNIVDCPHSTPVKANCITDYPCIRTSELKGGEISWDSMQYLDKNEYQIRITRLKPEAGDIVFGREGSIGDAVILPAGYFFSLGQRTMLLRANDLVNNVYLHRAILSEGFKEQIRKVNVSSTVAHVNIKDFKLFTLPLPPLPLQTAFAEKISAIEEMKKKLKASIAETQKMFDARMQEIFG